MKVTPISKEQADAGGAGGVWPNGNYDFEVDAAFEQESQAGNDMIKLELWIYNREGGRLKVFDYLVESEKARWKIRTFAAAVGLLRDYERGEIHCKDMEGKTGRCTIATQPARDGYQARNTVKFYLEPGGDRSGSSPRKSLSDDLDDSIPF